MAYMDDRSVKLTMDEYVALKAAESRFRDLVDSADGIVWEADAQTFTFTFVSEQAERLLGYPASDWLQPDFWVDHIHQDDKVWAPDYCASCTGKLEPHEFEYRFIAKDGRTVWLRDIVSVVSENGQPRWIRGIMVDISNRKKTEAELLHTYELLENAQRLANLGGWDIEPATQAGQVNWTKEVYRIHKLPFDFDPSVINKNIEFYVPEDRPIIAQALNRAMEFAESFDLELRLTRSEKEFIWVRVIGEPIIKNGAVVRIVGNIMDITNRKLAEEKSRELAYLDPLTELPNRRFFFERLKSAKASCERLNLKGALLFIDLDNFKQVNDHHGHDVGDQVLKAVANCLTECSREDDTVARLGGDEFIVMLEFVSRPGDDVIKRTQNVGDKILFKLKETCKHYHVTSSIGVAIFDGKSDTQDPLKQADLAMYEAKLKGRNTLCFYDAELPSKTLE